MESKRILILLMLSIFLSSLLVRPAFLQTGQPKYGGTFVTAIYSEPVTLLPTPTSRWADHCVSCKMYEGLVSHDLDGEPYGLLAESWTVSADGLTYTFNLRQNATWHDGVNFTSADVAFSVPVWYDVNPYGRTLFECIDTVDTPDDYTAVFNLKYVFPSLITYLCVRYATIMPKHIYEGTDIEDNPHNFADCVGTGPWMFDSWVAGQAITLVRNPNYWKGGLPYLDRLVFKIIPDATGRITALEAGEVDFVPYGVPTTEVERLMSLPDFETTYSGWELIAVTYAFRFNLRNPILDDVRVRKAMAYAVDRAQVAELGSSNVFSPEISTIAKTVQWCYNPDVEPYTQNLTKARELLDLAGYPEGGGGIRFSIECMHRSGAAEDQKMSEVLRDQWAAVGINLVLRPTETGVLYDLVGRFEFETYFATQPTGPEPVVEVGGAYHSKSMDLVDPEENIVGYNNSRVDWLLEQANIEPNRTVRAEYLKEFQEITVDELPTMTVVEKRYPSVASKDYKNIITNPWASRDQYETTYWTLGYDVSPEGAAEAIEDAEDTLDGLEAQFYDVTAAREKLDEAKAALADNNYASAQSLANEAVTLAVPPYLLYGIIAGAVIVVVLIAGVYWYRKRRLPTK